MLLELRAKRVEKRYLQVARESGVRDAVGECRLERVADSWDGCAFEGA
jgi:hypothetical protein